MFILSVETFFSNLAAAFFKLVIGLVLAITSVYLGTKLLDKLTSHIEEWKELKKGNVAVGILLAGIIISIAIIVQSSVSYAIATITPSVSFVTAVATVVVSIIKVLVGMVFAVFSIYVSIRVWDELTPDINETSELKKDNIAIAIVMVAVMIAVALVIRPAIDSILDVFEPNSMLRMVGL